MTIQWFPGHMHKARKELKETLKKVDLVIEIVDARLPFSSENPMLQKLRGQKPCVKVLNKADLADANVTKLWQDYLDRQLGLKCFPVSKDQADRIRSLPQLCRKLANSEATPDKTVTALVVGIPNVGKSTLINTLVGRQVAKTGNEPAVTKHQQRIALNSNFVLIDTPGMLWPNLENQHGAYRLAATAAIKDTALDHEDVVVYLLGFLLANYPDALKKRFRLENLPDDIPSLLEEIGNRRGCLGAGGRVQEDKVAKIVLAELRAGQFGPISLETPEMMERELREMAALKQAKLDGETNQTADASPAETESSGVD